MIQLKTKMNSNKRKSRKKLNLETIFRKSLEDNIREYTKHCCLGGVKQLSDPGIELWQRLIWTIVFLTALGTICYFLIYIWSNTLNKPLIVTMESSTFPISEMDFPAVAICNMNRISKKALKQLANEMYPLIAKKNESLATVEWALLQMGRLLDYSYNDTLRRHPLVLKLTDNFRHDTQRIVDVMKKLAPDCDEMLLKCAWAGEETDCKSIFTVRRTFHGHCCVFNYILDYDSAGSPDRTIAEVKRQNEAGQLYGLNVILDPMLEDYAYPLSNIRGFEVLLFDPSHFADPTAGRVIQRISEPNRAMFYELISTKQVATKEVRKYSLSTRNCLFHYESDEMFHGMYSYSACISHCRLETVQSLCKCTPYTVAASRTNQEGPVCSLDHMRCLNKYREKLLYLYPRDALTLEGLEEETQDSLFCPQCYPDCELTQHFTKSFRTKLATENFPEKDLKNVFFNNINMTDKCVLCIYHATPDSTLERLDVVNYWFEIISNFGGFGGIIVGLSFITFVEIFYFSTIRYCQTFYRNYRKYH